MNRPDYSPAINLGQIITVLTFIVTVGGFIWWQSAFQTSTELRLAVSEALSEKYVPTIDAMRQTLDVTNERLSTTMRALMELRDANRDLVKEVASVRERLGAIESRLKINREPFRP